MNEHLYYSSDIYDLSILYLFLQQVLKYRETLDQHYIMEQIVEKNK